MVYIEGMMDPAEMWKMLEEQYNPKFQVTLLRLVRKFMMAKEDESMDMDHHIQCVKVLKQQIEVQSEKISDTIYNSVLLNSLPEEYKILISILESTDKLIPAIIINRILEENRKMYDLKRSVCTLLKTRS